MVRKVGGFVRSNWFVCGIVCAVLAGLAAPRAGGVLDSGKVLSTLAVAVIFVLSGLSLPSEAMRDALGNVRAHLFLQGFIFVLVPAYFCATGALMGRWVDQRLVVGFCALAVMPTTISSCIVFTQMAGGNVATTIVNAVAANMLGVLLSPMLLTLLLRGSGSALPADEVLRVFARLVGKVLVPFVVGQLLRVRLRAFAARHRGRLGAAGGSMVLLIVFLAFCRAAGSGALRRDASFLALPLAYLAASNVLLMGGAFLGARLMRLARADVAAAVFVAPQKTLALGVPLLSTYFAARPGLLAFAMIPLLFYHPWQLLTAGLARRFVQLPRPRPNA